ncbi:myo-inosose-2 dehydratase [Pectinatus haikarae]|uniref:Inosose dehydratase n=1 Tax=Pectinatus haikarae TaxID=349096 RepID=A0ABT9Y8J0_9FIRM|nr:myo-inosose-2 dehydratase [Pectinatus haikarae]MDQ0204160.1 inosose dehydratase [Pectinatus haikarae]
MFENRKIHLGIAPIGWSNDDMPSLGGDISFEQCASEIALAGFEGTEVGGKFPAEPEILRKALNMRGIHISSQWFSSYLCSVSYEENEREFVKTLDFLKKFNAKRVNVCELTRCLFSSEKSMFGKFKPTASSEEWKRLCTGLDKLGRIAKNRGFKMCYHHHMATVVQTLEETKRLMESTNPEYVYLCYDTGHFTFSGENAVQAAKIFSSRIGHVHLKDIRQNKMKQAEEEGFRFRKAVLAGCFTIPGDGCVNFPEIFEILDKSGYEGWLLVEAEQDPGIANPFECAVRARTYIRKTTGL